MSNMSLLERDQHRRLCFTPCSEEHLRMERHGLIVQRYVTSLEYSLTSTDLCVHRFVTRIPEIPISPVLHSR
jgi:hypothetical protein